MLLTGLLGWPVGHSRSPAMQRAAFDAAGIEGVYVPLAVPPERLAPAVAGLVALGFRGANVTIPHKQAVLACLNPDYLSAAARAIGAANTLVIEPDGSILGENTDAPGFLADLTGQGVELAAVAREGALILGAGGSARAVTFGLASAGVPTLVVARRTGQALALVASLAPHLPSGTELAHGAWSDLQTLARPRALVVNCTPAGMSPHVEASPWPETLAFRPDQVAYDLVYNPPETRFMAQARAGGALAINGLGMLVHQGALSWTLWTGRTAPLEAMWRALASPTA